MNKKRLTALFLSLVIIFTFAGCSKNDVGEDKNKQDNEKAYYFVGGNLVGSFENGVFVSAVNPERDFNDESRYHKYTIKELFSDTYLFFDRDSADAEAKEAAIYTGMGPGGFDSDMSSKFEPYAVRTEESGSFAIIPVPCEFSEEFSGIYAPTYSFFANIQEEVDDLSVYPTLATNHDKTSLPDGLSWDNGFTQDDEEEIMRILEREGIKYEHPEINTVSGDFDSDGKTESIIFANAAKDAEGYLMISPEDGSAFSLILFLDDNEEYETVYSRFSKFTEDVTAHFVTIPIGVFDLDGDGSFEICVKSQEWEGGSTFVLARNDAGSWETVMTAFWGM